MVCINKVKNQIMKKAKWISFGCLLGIILTTGSCKETHQRRSNRHHGVSRIRDS